MSDDPVLSDPQFLEWAERQRAHLLPMIQDTSLVVSLVPEGPADMKFAVEMGLSIMLDKPIIVVVRPGTIIAGKLRMVADAIVEWEPGMGNDALMAEIDRQYDLLDPKKPDQEGPQT